jgi:hypothetical protein
MNDAPEELYRQLEAWKTEPINVAKTVTMQLNLSHEMVRVIHDILLWTPPASLLRFKQWDVDGYVVDGIDARDLFKELVKEAK